MNNANIVWTSDTRNAIQNLKQNLKQNQAAVLPFIANLQQIKLGQEGFGPAYYLIYRGKDPSNLEISDFHIILERPGLLLYEEPLTNNIQFEKDLGKVIGLTLSNNVTEQEVNATINQLTKNGIYKVRITEQDLGIENGKLNANGLTGKLHLHLEKFFPEPDKDGYITDISTLINIDAKSLFEGKTEQEILEVYKNLFPDIIK